MAWKALKSSTEGHWRGRWSWALDERLGLDTGHETFSSKKEERDRSREKEKEKRKGRDTKDKKKLPERNEKPRD